jgi:glutaredoxin 3
MQIKSNSDTLIEIWSQPDCAGCLSAKRMLHSKNIPYTERMLGVDATLEDLIIKLPGARSVPQIFIDGRHLGGLPELANYLNK